MEYGTTVGRYSEGKTRVLGEDVVVLLMCAPQYWLGIEPKNALGSDSLSHIETPNGR